MSNSFSNNVMHTGNMMQYQLSIRKINESDLSVIRPFMPEDENYEMYFSALVEDIEDLDCVAKLTHNGSDLIITIGKESSSEQFFEAVKVLLNSSYSDKLIANSGFIKLT
ncbi:hypothetical protein FFU37_18010 [Pseudoalteromonas distincta]|uniref:Uncharacterized protein n=2 Tax=Pseudoalteromonas distincta TaxID=77608 RepID=A0A4V1HDY2_9GAMM|nr:hypothetical protein FFU37_18010 [Pseudoalteromonas distincta]